MAYSDEYPNSEVYHRNDVVQELQRKLNEQKDIAETLRKTLELDKQEIARLNALLPRHNDEVSYK